MRDDHYFFGHAKLAASKSKDSTKVGAALVTGVGSVLLTAFNGPPMGVHDKPERFERPAKYLFASHAEQNLVAFAARYGIRMEACHVYVTHPCCASCAKSLIQAGVASVHVGNGTFTASAVWDDENAAAETMFFEAGIGYFKHES